MSLYLNQSRFRSGVSLVLSVCIALTLFSCQNSGSNKKGDQAEEDPNLITCERVGPVHKNSSPESLIEAFGADQLSQGTREIEGAERAITKVFPDKAEEVIVVWSAEDPNKVDQLIVWNENGPYHTKENLRVGISLRDIVRINNYLPVTFSNFYANLDGYGRISSFNGGEIEKNYPCMKGKLDIVRLKGIDAYALEDFKQVDTVQSGDQMVKNMVVKISEISIH